MIHGKIFELFKRQTTRTTSENESPRPKLTAVSAAILAMMADMAETSRLRSRQRIVWKEDGMVNSDNIHNDDISSITTLQENTQVVAWVSMMVSFVEIIVQVSV